MWSLYRARSRVGELHRRRAGNAMYGGAFVGRPSDGVARHDLMAGDLMWSR